MQVWMASRDAAGNCFLNCVSFFKLLQHARARGRGFDLTGGSRGRGHGRSGNTCWKSSPPVPPAAPLLCPQLSVIRCARARPFGENEPSSAPQGVHAECIQNLSNSQIIIFLQRPLRASGLCDSRDVFEGRRWKLFFLLFRNLQMSLACMPGGARGGVVITGGSRGRGHRRKREHAGSPRLWLPPPLCDCHFLLKKRLPPPLCIMSVCFLLVPRICLVLALR